MGRLELDRTVTLGAVLIACRVYKAFRAIPLIFSPTLSSKYREAFKLRKPRVRALDNVTCTRGALKVTSLQEPGLQLMASPSQPVAIKSPRLLPNDRIEGVSSSFATTPIGTPADFRALRAQYTGTPPVLPNIPPRVSTPARSGPGSLIPASDAYSVRPGPQVVGGISALASRNSNPSLAGNRSETPPVMDLDTLPDEEKAKVLRRLLALPQERQNNGAGAESIAGSEREDLHESEQASTPRPSSFSAEPTPPADQESFPIPYHAPGADVT
jgi:proton-coupled amino acid transporter